MRLFLLFSLHSYPTWPFNKNGLATSQYFHPVSTEHLLFSTTASWFDKRAFLSIHCLFCPVYSLFQPWSSHLFISITITTTNVLIDLLALHREVEASEEKSESKHERQIERGTERKRHPPTLKKAFISNCTLCSPIMWDIRFPMKFLCIHMITGMCMFIYCATIKLTFRWKYWEHPIIIIQRTT